MSTSFLPLHERSLSLDHEGLIQLLARESNLLIIQDLDGVCMGLVKDPLTRVIDPNYLEATQLFDGHFYVLTNGEHIGKRGINSIIERAYNDDNLVKNRGLYLPGLAGGGVQWQDRYGEVSHPGVSDQELGFLASVPQVIETSLKGFFSQDNYGLDYSTILDCIQATVLDNKVSPTANLNVFHEVFIDQENDYLKLQQRMKQLMDELLENAQNKGLKNSFFVHYAPNLGKDKQGQEMMQLAQGKDSGTTDFQFMLRGAIKEVGILVILNRYYYQKTGKYPLGEGFNVRQAPRKHEELLSLIKERFDPDQMPIIVGVGDTVTSKAITNDDKLSFGRGGSDRGFLELIQEIGKEFKTGNIIVYIDSSDGEVKNRKPLKTEKINDEIRVIEGPGDPRDQHDPLTLNVVFPGGHKQYIQCFREAAQSRKN
ncbi:glucosylglycerol 3-phosphatase [Crocosphaera sp. UHCC 0190]|uniref:glucosylglycerol 3-phosphatase n=1 Tax=Crocosphaera sp. UHCC 0190 TaxID=3110246 RepID=UPI002B1FE658|nr:glucosylglycerol 3-phosphatase [Crocosphaera sp. UHCC 0190]MEA5511654.1 glucosylglycerol 3-phosphatase [Crocosphaera sp. UHCC 0190]